MTTALLTWTGPLTRRPRGKRRKARLPARVWRRLAGQSARTLTLFGGVVAVGAADAGNLPLAAAGVVMAVAAVPVGVTM